VKMLRQRWSTPVQVTIRPRRQSRARALAARAEERKTAQLATAKLPADADPAVFADSMFTWANTLTSSGANLPFVLPQRVDRLPGGFEMAFIRLDDDTNEPYSVGELRAEVEPINDGKAHALIVRGCGDMDRLVDVPLIMQSMVPAIRKAALIASTK